MAVTSGNSYGTYLRSDASASFRTIPDGTAFSSFPVTLLPLEVAPPEDQIRIFVDKTEILFRDLKSLSPASTNYWTYSTDSGSLVVTLSDDITIDSSSRITIVRQTKGNSPWVYPVPGSKARPEEFMIFYDQIMFIVQEMCELEEIGNDVLGFFTVPEPNPYTAGNQMQLDVGGSSRATVGYDEIELMPAWIGQIATGAWTGVDEAQLIVEVGDQEDGTSTEWTEVDASDRTVDVDNETVTITTGAVTEDIRVRRNTDKTRWWYDPRTAKPGWNTMGITAIEKQAQFLLEEICFIPEMLDLNPLATRRFPMHRYFVYSGTQNDWRVPGWDGDGPTVYIWKNDVLLDEDTDFTIDDFGTITWIIDEPTTGDTTVISTDVNGWNNLRGVSIRFPRAPKLADDDGAIDIESLLDGDTLEVFSVDPVDLRNGNDPSGITFTNMPTTSFGRRLLGMLYTADNGFQMFKAFYGLRQVETGGNDWATEDTGLWDFDNPAGWSKSTGGSYTKMNDFKMLDSGSPHSTSKPADFPGVESELRDQSIITDPSTWPFSYKVGQAITKKPFPSDPVGTQTPPLTLDPGETLEPLTHFPFLSYFPGSDCFRVGDGTLTQGTGWSV